MMNKIWDDDVEVAEGESYEAACEANYDRLDALRKKFDKELSGRVLCVADLGLWNGRRSGYRVLGGNLSSIFDVTATTFAFDAHNVIGEEIHHDGTNYYTFKLIPDGVDAQPLLNAIYYGKATPKMIRRYTRSLRKYVAEALAE